MEVEAQLFQVENVSPGKTAKTLNISDTIQLIFIKFYQNDHTVSGHLILLTDDLGNVGQCQNLQKCGYF